MDIILKHYQATVETSEKTALSYRILAFGLGRAQKGSGIEEGFIVKRRQRSSLPLWGQIDSIPSRALAFLHQDDF